MKTERQNMRDLLDEAKKRIVLVLVCVVGLSYLMSLTSSSVWVNLPAAASLIIFFRYVSLDLDMRRKSSSSYMPSSVSKEKKTLELKTFSADNLSWRKKVDSPVVEVAIDQFTRHLISEWVTNLWYSRITPDKEGPEDLIMIMNHVLGEVSLRARDVNLINLLTRDSINLICTHLELYRSTQLKIGKVKLGTASNDHRDAQIKMTLLGENKLHPALVSAEAEHRVLQHLSAGLISLLLKPEELNCAFLQHTVRELLACAVIRPLLNMANPRVVNEKIESLVTSISKRANEIIPVGLENSSGPPDGSDGGLELMQLKSDNSSAHTQVLLRQYSIDAPTYLARGSSSVEERKTEACASRSKWRDTGDIISVRKTQALAPENIENMWTKGWNYKEKEDLNKDPRASVKFDPSKVAVLKRHNNGDLSSHPSDSLSQETLCQHINQGDTEIDSEGSYQADDDDSNTITGLDSPVTMVWDSKTKRNSSASHIRHPLESFEFSSQKKNNKSWSHHGRKRCKTVGQKISSRIEAERASFLPGECGDVHEIEESETEISERFHSGSAASSSKSSDIVVAEDSFFQLKCEVIGSNIVKSGMGTFAVYSIAVTDAANNIWSIKRRFRHFEDLHRRLKEFPEYNLHLPPKHFLSSGLDVPVIRERSKFLDKYLKMLLHIPVLSRSMEVWDFLSVDSQTYTFAESFSIVQTLSVDLDYKPHESNEGSENVNIKSGLEKSKSTGENACLPAKEKSESEKSGFKTSQQEPSLSALEAISESTIPVEWIPPNLSVPILDLVDVVFQLQDGGWMRRKVFWIAKQVLQLGMGDAFDDWLIGKIRILRRGSFVASAIYRIEQILWPDGIFMTKHPNRKRFPPDQNLWTDEQRREAARRADFVHDLIIKKAPTALVGIIGRKEYEQCAEDVYFFLQSSVCLKQLSFDLLERLLLALFPELDHVIRQIHEDQDPLAVPQTNR